MKKLKISCTNCQAQHDADVKNFSGGMARTLIALCRRYQLTNAWVDAKAAGLGQGDLEKLALWTFAQQQAPQGRKKKSGIWMPTDAGWKFAMGQTFTSPALLTSNGLFAGYVDKQVGIQHIIKPEEVTKLWAA